MILQRHRWIHYKKVSIGLVPFNLFWIPTKLRKTYILKKLDPFQVSLLQDISVYLYKLQSCQNYNFLNNKGARQQILQYPFNVNKNTSRLSILKHNLFYQRTVTLFHVFRKIFKVSKPYKFGERCFAMLAKLWAILCRLSEDLKPQRCKLIFVTKLKHKFAYHWYNL